MLYSRVSLYAMMLAAAGIPLYIHLPRFASVNLGISLATLGSLLLAIRVIDLVQDPAIGWVVDRFPNAQPFFAVLSAIGLAVGFPLLFSLGEDANVVAKLTVILVVLFSAYSLGIILLYGRSATLARHPAPSELMRLATYREVGMLSGVVIAAIMPAIFVGFGAGGQGYPALGWFLGVMAIGVAILTLPAWRRPVVLGEALSLGGLVNAGALKLLVLAMINSLPVAITSTLFLFFVEDRLLLDGMAGVFLILFFVSAGVTVPVWAKISQRVGGKKALLFAIPMSILGFVGAAFIAPENPVGFALICLASGAALGADLVILPAMFSVALTQAGLKASAAFGIWSFAGKLGLALAAFVVLPMLERSGFNAGQPNSPQALQTLNIAYAVIPCILKLGALLMVLSLPNKELSS